MAHDILLPERLDVGDAAPCSSTWRSRSWCWSGCPHVRRGLRRRCGSAAARRRTPPTPARCRPRWRGRSTTSTTRRLAGGVADMSGRSRPPGQQGLERAAPGVNMSWACPTGVVGDCARADVYRNGEFGSAQPAGDLRTGARHHQPGRARDGHGRRRGRPTAPTACGRSRSPTSGSRCSARRTTTSTITGRRTAAAAVELDPARTLYTPDRI